MAPIAKAKRTTTVAAVKVTRLLTDIVTSLFFSFQENPPRDLEPAIHRVVFEGGVVFQLVIEARPGTLSDWKKIPEVERPNILPSHWIADELVTARRRTTTAAPAMAPVAAAVTPSTKAAIQGFFAMR